jgi:uncharacterized phage protein (TIGR02220 family)
MQGYIKLHRKILEWEWYQDSKMVSLFIHCLLKANFEDKKWQGIDIKRGSFITSYETLSNELSNRYNKFSIQMVRTCLARLRATGEITSKSNNRYTVLTINNYDEYQGDNTPDVQHLTSQQQTNNKQITTTKNDKNVKNDKNIYLYPEFIQKFNEIFSSKYTTKNQKAATQFKARIADGYTMEDFITALHNAKSDDFHRENNYKYINPEFITRSDKLERFLNMKPRTFGNSSNPLAVKAEPGKYDNLKINKINNENDK